MNLSFESGGTVVINGQSYKGNNVSIAGGVVTIDGVRQDGEFKEKTLNISISGDVASLKTASGNITVNGYCEEVETVSGDVTCEDVQGSVETVSGNVKAEVIHGKVRTVSGNVRGSK